MAAHEHGGRVTVLALAAEERPSSRCCDTRAVQTIVLVDPPASGLTRFERRRLRRTSPVPVSS